MYFFWDVQENFQVTLLILKHAFARVENKAIINKGINFYLEKHQKINSTYK